MGHRTQGHDECLGIHQACWLIGRIVLIMRLARKIGDDDCLDLVGSLS